MWTVENRARYDRGWLRYPSGLTDEEWALVRPQIPRARRGGNKRSVDERAVMNGLMYVLSTGCQWRAIPKDLPPRSTVNHYFCCWQDDGTLDRVHHALYVLWMHRDAARARIRVLVKRILRKYGYPPDLQDAAVQTVLQQAEALSADWAA